MAGDHITSSLAIVKRPRMLHSWNVTCQGVTLCGPFPSVPCSGCPQVSHGSCSLGCVCAGALHCGCCSHPMYPYGDSHCHPPLGPRLCWGRGEGGCQEDGRVASVGSMPGRGRAGSVQFLEVRVLLRGSAALGCTSTGATGSVQVLVEVCTHCPLGSLPWSWVVARSVESWGALATRLGQGVGDVPLSVVGGVATQFVVQPSQVR